MALPTKDELYEAAKSRADKVFTAIHAEFSALADAAKTNEDRLAVALHSISFAAILAYRSREVLTNQVAALDTFKSTARQ